MNKIDNKVMIQEAIDAVRGNSQKSTCDCQTVIPKKAEGGRAAVFSGIERHGYSIIRIQYYRKSDGEPSRTFCYKSKDWRYCPFCGKPI